MFVNGKYMNTVNRIPVGNANPANLPQIKAQGGFKAILDQKMDAAAGVKFSKHAELRIQSRNMNITQEQKERLNNALRKAEEKGIKDSLILIENMAFVVNVKNRTVITALSSNELRENVFTNIDGAIFA